MQDHKLAIHCLHVHIIPFCKSVVYIVVLSKMENLCVAIVVI